MHPKEATILYLFKVLRSNKAMTFRRLMHMHFDIFLKTQCRIINSFKYEQNAVVYCQVIPKCRLVLFNLKKKMTL